MSKAKKKSLPKNFKELLKFGDIEALKAVFEECDVNARGGVFKSTALSFSECPDELTRWLVKNGADLNVTDQYGNTPLHHIARYWRGPTQPSVQLLIELGADVNASASIGSPLHAAADSKNAPNAALLIAHGAHVNGKNRSDLSPLEVALQGCSSSDIERIAPLARVLLNTGAEKTPTAKQFVTQIGERFEFIRDKFNPETVDVSSSSLDELYSLFDVPPVPRRQIHDGKKPIHVKAIVWTEQHQELWRQLVPGTGPAATMQGEVIRISGRITDEISRNGGANWDADFRKMSKAFLDIVRSGTALPFEQLQDCEAIIVSLNRREAGDAYLLAKSAVSWVLLNPQPKPLEKPSYRR